MIDHRLRIKLTLAQAQDLVTWLQPMIVWVNKNVLKESDIDITLSVSVLESMYVKVSKKVFFNAPSMVITMNLCEQLAFIKAYEYSLEHASHMDLTLIQFIHYAIDKKIIKK